MLVIDLPTLALVKPSMSSTQEPYRSPSVPRAAHSPRSPRAPQFEDPPEDASDELQQPEHAEDDDEDEIPYPEPSSEQTLLPPANFRPFFTLIEDTASGEHYHPYVHYVFADDDPVLVTAASMRSLGLDDAKFLPQSTPVHEEEKSLHDEEGDSEGSPVESPLPLPIPGVKEHYLIVDLGADGRTIADAQSLSPEWQVTNTSIRTAPSFDESSPDQGYMLRIEGVEIMGKTKGKGKAQPGMDKLSQARGKSQGDMFEALDDLLQEIEGGLDVATKIQSGRSQEGQEAVTNVRAVDADDNPAT
jgi:hypothetical protein